MSRPGRMFAAAACVAPVLVLLAAVPSYAGGGLQRCLDKALDHNGEPPTCTKINGTWVASWPGDDAMGGNPAADGFVALFVFAAMVGVAILVWRVTTARNLAREAGMDPELATQMTLLSDDGLDTTYLASSLRQPPVGQASRPPGPTPSAASSRLEELRSLLDRGLVTQAEYDERRRAIIDSV